MTNFKIEIETLLGDFEVASWIQVRGAELASSHSFFAGAASAGMIARLGMGTTNDPKAALDAILQGTESPAMHVSTWAKSLRGEVRAELISIFLEEAGSLAADIAGLTLPDTAGLVAHALRVRRDDLESVGFVLRAAAQGDLVATVLDAVDRVALEHLSAFDVAGDSEPDDLHLLSVAWQQPDAWWGACRRTFRLAEGDRS